MFHLIIIQFFKSLHQRKDKIFYEVKSYKMQSTTLHIVKKKIQVSKMITIAIVKNSQCLVEGSHCACNTSGADMATGCLVLEWRVSGHCLLLHHPQQSTGHVHLFLPLHQKWEGSFSLQYFLCIYFCQYY